MYCSELPRRELLLPLPSQKLSPQELPPRELYIYYSKLSLGSCPPESSLYIVVSCLSKKLPFKKLPFKKLFPQELFPRGLFSRELSPREFFIYYSELSPREKI
jgi:hypothetical protein